MLSRSLPQLSSRIDALFLSILEGHGHFSLTPAVQSRRNGVLEPCVRRSPPEQ